MVDWPYRVEPMLLALDEGRALLIQGNLSEDADRRADNQYVWDLWTLAQRGDGVPPEGLDSLRIRPDKRR